MKFIVDGTQVYCVRTAQDISPREAASAAVVTFDAQLDSIAPHVGAALRPHERAELDAWLRQRASIQERSKDAVLVASLAELLTQAAGAIERGLVLDPGTRQRLEDGLAQLRAALENAAPAAAAPPGQPDAMDDDEALRQHLDVLRRSL